jgi:hypothetical protein
VLCYFSEEEKDVVNISMRKSVQGGGESFLIKLTRFAC